MKKTLCAFLLLLAITSCKKEETPDSDVHYDAAQAYDLSNIAYGDDAKQKMDVYLPANRDSISTKVFVLIHGGGWSAGDKADYTSTMASFKTYYPDHAIININYRLGTVASPGYPKQIQDISAALAEIQRPGPTMRSLWRIRLWKPWRCSGWPMNCMFAGCHSCRAS